MKRYRSICLALTFFLAAGASAQQSEKDKTGAGATKPADTKPAEKQAAPAPAATAVPATTDPNYVIGAEDVLEVSVWNETQISRAVPVRPDGKISLPLLGDVQAAGLTPSQLSAQITDGLKKFNRDPQVTVIVTGVNSRRYYVTGEVARAGTYPLLPEMTVLQALASSGGFTAFARRSKIYILRTSGGKQERVPFDYDKVVKGKSPDVVLRPGDTIVIP